MGASECCNHPLNGRKGIRPLGLFMTLVNYDDVLGDHLGHNLRRVGCDDDLWIATPHVSNQSPLQIGVHIDIRLVENDRVRSLRACQEPHRLQPHLETVAHYRDLAHKISIADLKIERITRMASMAKEFNYSQAAPRFFD